jgi:hypothetical protein
MTERRDEPGFGLEALLPIASFAEFFWKDLECDRTIEARVPSAVDQPHTSCPEDRLDLVGSEPDAWSQHHGGGLILRPAEAGHYVQGADDSRMVIESTP